MDLSREELLRYSRHLILPNVELEGQRRLKASRILIVGAHPDDADIKAGGTAAKWFALGHVVKLVSLTNGQAGHQSRVGQVVEERQPECRPQPAGEPGAQQ